MPCCTAVSAVASSLNCLPVEGMDLPRLTWQSRNGEGSCLQYGKGLGVRDDSPTNVNFNASEY